MLASAGKTRACNRSLIECRKTTSHGSSVWLQRLSRPQAYASRWQIND
jgi:hypothetical protein